MKIATGISTASGASNLCQAIWIIADMFTFRKLVRLTKAFPAMQTEALSCRSGHGGFRAGITRLAGLKPADQCYRRWSRAAPSKRCQCVGRCAAYHHEHHCDRYYTQYADVCRFTQIYRAEAVMAGVGVIPDPSVDCHNLLVADDAVPARARSAPRRAKSRLCRYARSG